MICAFIDDSSDGNTFLLAGWVGFFAVTASVLQIERDGGNNERRVDFVFDEQEGLFKTCVKVCEKLKTDFPTELKTIAGNVSEADDKLTPPLQAADLLVGQFVTQFRISPPEPFFQKMATCHKIFSSTAYVPNFESIPSLISHLDIAWSKKFRPGAEKPESDVDDVKGE